MPKLRNLANRTKELNTFLKMVRGDHECRILLIEGESGMGKSSLLRQFKQKCPPEVKYVTLDCKGSSSIPDFLSQVMNCLGRKKFQSFGNQLKTFIQGGVDFSENDIKAEEISIAINGTNINSQAQAYRLHRLHDAFFEDLAKFENRIIIALDTYQMANETLKTWIEGTWLGTVEQRLEKVVTVIAGQSIPDPNHVIWGDGCEHFPLTPIDDLTAWCKFCSDLPEYSKLSDDSIKTIILIANGHPLSVTQMLSVTEKRW